MQQVEVANNLKPGNAPRCHWRDDDKHTATPIALLYLHGFTASPGEAGDLPVRMADALAANLYIHRWPGHGLNSPDAMRGLTLDALQNSALAALKKVRRMGERIVIVGSSLGASLGLWLAAVRPDDVSAVVAWSPGVQAANTVLLDQVCASEEPFTDVRPRNADVLAFWSVTVHPDGPRALRSMFRSFAAEPPWPRVRCPVFLGYFRAPNGDEDQTASVPAMLNMFAMLGTEPAHKRSMAFASGAHVIGSPYKSPLAEEVARVSTEFLKEHVADADLREGGVGQ